MVTHLPATPENVALLRTIDGRKTLKQVFAIAASRMGAGGCEQAHERLQAAYRDLAQRSEVLDWLRVRHRSQLPYPTYAQMQGRLKARSVSAA